MRKQIPKNKSRRVKETDEKTCAPIGAQVPFMQEKAGRIRAGAKIRTGLK